jgi:hypothetical protein
VVIDGTTDGSGNITDNRVWTLSTPVTGTVRKSTASPFYKPGSINGTIATTQDTSFPVVLIFDE